MPITSKLDDEELMRRPSRRSNACTFSSSFCCYCIEERSAGPACVVVVVVVVPGMNAVLHVCRGCHTQRGRVELGAAEESAWYRERVTVSGARQ